MHYDACPRYTSLPFPPYAFLPGHNPHPKADPRGHGGIVPIPDEPLHPSAWRSHIGYLFGCDLYNAGFFWEAHEAWEAAWTGIPRGEPVRAFLQGLIQVANAQLKRRMDRPAAVARLRPRYRALLEPLASDIPFCGLPLKPWLAATEASFETSAPFTPIRLVDE